MARCGGGKNVKKEEDKKQTKEAESTKTGSKSSSKK